jgi:hypothetical protein
MLLVVGECPLPFILFLFLISICIDDNHELVLVISLTHTWSLM